MPLLIRPCGDSGKQTRVTKTTCTLDHNHKLILSNLRHLRKSNENWTNIKENIRSHKVYAALLTCLLNELNGALNMSEFEYTCIVKSRFKLHSNKQWVIFDVICINRWIEGRRQLSCRTNRNESEKVSIQICSKTSPMSLYRKVSSAMKRPDLIVGSFSLKQAVHGINEYIRTDQTVV